MGKVTAGGGVGERIGRGNFVSCCKQLEAQSLARSSREVWLHSVSAWLLPKPITVCSGYNEVA